MWAALLQSAGSKAAMQTGKKMAMNAAKQAAANKVKSVVKKKKVKGKDIAKKMLGGGGGDSSGGGALVVRPSSSIVSSPAGGLVPSSKGDEGGSLVVKSGAADDLGLTPFMESISGLKESVKSIKKSLNDNAKDAEKRIEKQRLLNAQLEREEQEEELETKKPGLGKKLLAPATKAGKSFLQKLKTFFTNVLLGMLVNGLVGGQRDVVVTFLLGYRQYRMAKSAAIKFIAKIAGGIKGGLKGAAGQLRKSGKSIFQTLVGVGNKLKAWVAKGIKTVMKGVAETVKRTPEALKALNKLRKTPIKETIKSIQKSRIGQRVGGVLNKGKNVLSKGKNVLSKGKNLLSNMIKGGSKGPGLFGQLKNLGGRAITGLKSAGTTVIKKTTEQVVKAKNIVGDGINSLKSSADNLMKGAAAKIKSWKKNIDAMLELAGNPAKLFEKAKAFFDGKLKDVVKNNKTWKQLEKLKNMKPEKIAGKIGGILNGLKKSKEVMKVVNVLKTAKKNMKIPMLDRILALILGVVDYTLLGESPINATLKALGGLLGFSFGTALGAPLGPGAFVTGVAGGFVGEQLGNGISAIIAELGADKIPDPIAAATPGMSPRPLARNPFGKGAEEFDKQQEELASANFAEGKSSVSYTAEEISESASYEEESQDETVILDSGGGGAIETPPSKEGSSKIIPLGVDNKTIVNSQYESQTKATLYKV